MTRTIATAVSLAAILMLAGCATGGTVVDTSCTSFGTITYSASGDTEETKRQIRGHNAAWRRLCSR